MEDKRKTDAHSANSSNQTVVPKSRPSAIARAAYFLAHFPALSIPRPIFLGPRDPVVSELAYVGVQRGGGGAIGGS